MPFSILCYHILTNYSNETITEMEPQDKWLKIEEPAAYMKMSRTKLYQMARKGKLPASKIVTQRRFDWEKIDDLLRSRQPVCDKQKQEGVAQ